MRVIEKYVCECCGGEFALQSEAERCEKRHLHPQRTDFIYPVARFTRFNETTYPSEVRVHFEDGSFAVYTDKGRVPPRKGKAPAGGTQGEEKTSSQK